MVDFVRWLHERCGKSEEAHSIMKEDLAGGRLPSSDFGGNAAWWWIMILALNLNSAMKQLVLTESWNHLFCCKAPRNPVNVASWPARLFHLILGRPINMQCVPFH
jgi:hypothetical protein